MKTTIKMVLAMAVIATAIPKQVFATEVSVDQVIAQKRQQNEAANAQLISLKAQLSDMQTELDQEQNRFGYSASKWVRNIGLGVAGIAALATVVDVKIHAAGQYNFFLYGLVSAGAGLVGGLGEVGVILTDDQVVNLSAKIKALKAKIEVAQANLARQ